MLPNQTIHLNNGDERRFKTWKRGRRGGRCAGAACRLPWASRILRPRATLTGAPECEAALAMWCAPCPGVTLWGHVMVVWPGCLQR